MNRVVAIGDFDGVHLGHRALLEKLREWSAELGAEPFILTFEGNSKGKPVITDLAAKEVLFAELGIKQWRALSFADWKDVPAKTFAADFLKKELCAIGVVIGGDFRFGKERRGSEFTLIEERIAVKKVEYRLAEGERISSSVIRAAIAAGRLEEAERLMGHPLLLIGNARHGKGLASRYGMPTVNLRLSSAQILPPFGVYAAWVTLRGTRYPAAVNIGVRPTVERDAPPNLEAHLLAELPSFYGENVRVEPVSFVRAEQIFPSETDLFSAIRTDAEKCRAILELLQ